MDCFTQKSFQNDPHGSTHGGNPSPVIKNLRMILPLAPAHFMALAAFLVYALLLFLDPGIAAAPLLLFVATCLAAPFFPRFSFYLPIVSRGMKGVQGVALTFDDGPDLQVTPLVLDLLERHSVKATFFVIGEKAGKHPELLQEILSRGHSVGNHSQSHPPFLMLQGKRAIAREVGFAQATIRRSGIVPLAFRPPVGITNPDLWRVLLDQGMFCVNFSCRAGDMGNRRVGGLGQKLARKARARDIILLHDTLPHKVTVDCLLAEFDNLIKGLKERGLDIMPLADLIGKEIMETGAASGRPMPAGRSGCMPPEVAAGRDSDP